MLTYGCAHRSSRADARRMLPRMGKTHPRAAEIPARGTIGRGSERGVEGDAVRALV